MSFMNNSFMLWLHLNSSVCFLSGH